MPHVQVVIPKRKKKKPTPAALAASIASVAPAKKTEPTNSGSHAGTAFALMRAPTPASVSGPALALAQTPVLGSEPNRREPSTAVPKTPVLSAAEIAAKAITAAMAKSEAKGREVAAKTITERNEDGDRPGVITIGDDD
jgi:hypothetical protein